MRASALTVSDVGTLLDRLEELVGRLDAMPQETQRQVAELIDVLDALHRSAVNELGSALGEERIDALRERHPAIAWLFDAYLRGDELAEAEAALDTIRPYIHSHGGDVEVLGADDGVVRVRLSGACSGCTASAVTLQHGVEEALEAQLPTFRRLEVEEDEDAAPHPPPGPTLLDDDHRSLPLHPG